ncbi:MAG: chromosome partitioning protein ParA, partial [Paludibacteraceae bacterium]|nr:chromosome partitioning protein ParA [Paludibacteraceae bacterium]
MTNNASPKTPVKRDEVLLQDIFSIYLSNWKWILLSLFLCLAIGTYHILTTPPSYKCTSSLLIKQDKDGQSLLGDVAMSMTDIGLSQFKINTSNVIMTFQTPDIIHTVIQRLHLNDSYTVKGTFRDEILYGSSLPFTLSFIDMPNHGEGNLVACLKSDSLVHLTNFAIGDSLFKEEYTVHMGDTILSPLGHISVQRNNYYTGGSFTQPIQIAHISAYDAIGEFKEKLSVSLRDKMGTVFDLSFTDQSRERAIDVLKMVTNVYDEFWMQDKNKVTLSTVNFISQRLRILEDDLNSVDGEIATYKSSQRIPDIHATANYDLTLAGENERNLQQHANELTVAQYLLNFLKENKDKLMPANVGVTEQSIQAQIAEYNKLTLQRSRFVESSSEENLLVKDIDNQLVALRGAIISSVENYITALQLQLDSYESNRHEINSRISSNPRQAGHLLSAERQQKVKEGLYLFLLQKKEEFEISQAFTAYDTRVIMEPEYGGGDKPFSPNKKNVLALALLLGLAIPFVILYVRELLNTRVRGRKDLESLTIPYVGEIPLVSQKNHISPFSFLRKEETDEEVELVVKPQSRDIIN